MFLQFLKESGFIIPEKNFSNYGWSNLTMPSILNMNYLHNYPNYSVNDIANMIHNNQTYIPKREGEAETTLADVSKIKNMINWEAEVSIEEWIRDQL